MKTFTPEADLELPVRPAPEASPSLLRKIWRVLFHPILLGGLVFVMVWVIAAHLWLPQVPTALANDPVAAASWLDGIAATIPGGRVFRALGLFDLTHNLALRVVLPLLAAVLLARLAAKSWRAWHVRKLAPPKLWMPGLQALDVAVTPPPSPDSLTNACHVLSPSSRFTRLDEEGEEISLICDSHHRLQWVGLSWELGLLVALGALLLNLYSGWQIEPMVLDPGQSASLAPYKTMDVALSDDASEIVLCCPEVKSPVARGMVRSKGVIARVISIGQAARVALLRNEHPIQLQAIEENARVARQLVIHFPEARSERVIAAPEVNMAFRLVALDDGRVRVQALDVDNQTLFSRDVTEDAELSVEKGLILQIDPTTFVTLRVWGRPWTWLLWPATMLVIIGLFADWRWAYWRMGIRINDAGATIRWQGGVSTLVKMHRLLAMVQHALDAPSSQSNLTTQIDS